MCSVLIIEYRPSYSHTKFYTSSWERANQSEWLLFNTNLAIFLLYHDRANQNTVSNEQRVMIGMVITLWNRVLVSYLYIKIIQSEHYIHRTQCSDWLSFHRWKHCVLVYKSYQQNSVSSTSVKLDLPTNSILLTIH